MASVLKKIEYEDVVFLVDNCYNDELRFKCKSLFDNLKEKGVIKSNYTDDTWMVYSGIKNFGINFSFDEKEYENHAYTVLGISSKKIKELLRVYAINNMGTYIAASIAKRMRVIRSFLTDFGNNAFQTTIEELTFIIDFLAFIRTPEATISWIN